MPTETAPRPFAVVTGASTGLVMNLRESSLKAGSMFR
jgi:hypothetical protein